LIKNTERSFQLASYGEKLQNRELSRLCLPDISFLISSASIGCFGHQTIFFSSGNTALHDCAESGSLEILKILLSCKAQMAKDSYGMTPLLAASVTGHTNVVEYLISRTQCCREEKVDALELLGATYVDKKRDMLGALQYWRRAMDERYADKSKIIRKPTLESSIAAYEGAKEFQTHTELLDVISDPDNMRMQALLVRERILGPAHPDTSYYIRYRGAVYADMGNFERCITLWMYALEMQQKNLEPLNPMTQSSFLSFAELFSFMMTSASRQRPTMPISFFDMMVVLNKATDELQKGLQALAKSPPKTEKDSSHFNRLLVILMHLLALMCRSCAEGGPDDPPKTRMSTEQELDFKKKIYQLVHLNPCGSKGHSLLHLACSAETSSVGRYPVCPFPCLEVAELLIEVGASVNANDIENNTPLHTAALNKPCKVEIMKLLLDKGAHLDACNLDHKTPMQLMRNTTIYDVVSPLKYINLQCMAASAIIKHAIPYKGHVPKKLETFVQLH
jgi:ankyrin repeat protein